MKKTLLLILILALMANTTMAKIKIPKGGKGGRGKLSAREYAAQQMGGKLDYKKSTISVPVKSSPKKSSSKISTPAPQRKATIVGYDQGGPVLGYEGDTSASSPTSYLETLRKNEGETYVPSTQSYKTYDVKDKVYKTTDGSSSKKVDSNNRTSASKVFNTITGTKTANASGGGTITGTPKKTWYERGLEIAKDPFGFEPKVRGLVADKPWEKGIEGLLSYESNPIYQTEQGAGDAISQLLAGKTPELGLSETFTNDETGVFGSQQNQPYEPYAPDYRNEPAPKNSPFVNYGAYEDYSSKRNERPERKALPVSNPYTAPTQYQAPQYSESPQDFSSPQSQPDYTSQRNEQERTVRGMGGQGIFSKGEFGNGAGDYGVEVTYGTNLQDEESLLNKLLGIPTAQAFEMPQTNMGSLSNFYNPTAKRVLGIQQQSMFQPGYQEPQRGMEAPTGGYTQAPTGGSTFQGGQQGVPQGQPQQRQQMPQDDGYNKQIKQQEKYFKQQEKAQKKMLEEIIKGIQSQYGQSRTEGETALGQSKQEDLLRLSGLFGFANQDPNSEQRQQYEQRTQSDYAGRLGDFLNKLMQGQTQDITGAKQNYQGNLSNIASQRQQVMQQLHQAQQEQAMKMAELIMKSGRATTPKYNENTFYSQANQMKQAGNSWGDIAYKLGKNFNLTPGSDYSSQLDAIMTGQAPAQKPGASNQPFPTKGPNGEIIDGNRYSPTYGMELEQY